jgi:hypothetical protein
MVVPPRPRASSRGGTQSDDYSGGSAERKGAAHTRLSAGLVRGPSASDGAAARAKEGEDGDGMSTQKNKRMW